MVEQAQLMRKTQEVAVLSRVSELLASLNLDDVLSKTLALLTGTVGAERGSFFVFDEDSPTAQHIITRRNLPPERKQLVVSHVLDQGLAGWVYRHKQGALVADTATDERWVQFADEQPMHGSALCVPFMVEGVINGIMTLEHQSANFFTEGDLALAQAVANQTAVALRNAQLFNEVQTHERQLQAVLESAAEPLITISPQGAIRMANPAALALIGASLDEIVGHSLADITTSPLFAKIAQMVDSGQEQFEVRDEQAHIDYAVRVSSWREGRTNSLGHVLVFNDVTMLKNLARLKSQMLEVASHDLRNPLGVVQGYVELMLMDIQPDNDPHGHLGYLQDIARVTRRMLKMVNELLNLERIESSARQEFEPYEPNVLLTDAINEERANAEEKGQTLRVEIEADLPRMQGTPSQIREAFANLIGNAIKYTPDGGTIAVYAKLTHNNNRLDFRVVDNGLGIPEKLQGNIFQRFYRAHQPGAEEIPGTGLGLSLVKAIVEHHGGEIWFKSKAGQGSVFGFWLPIPDPSQIGHNNLD